MKTHNLVRNMAPFKYIPPETDDILVLLDVFSFSQISFLLVVRFTFQPLFHFLDFLSSRSQYPCSTGDALTQWFSDKGTHWVPPFENRWVKAPRWVKGHAKESAPHLCDRCWPACSERVGRWSWWRWRRQALRRWLHCYWRCLWGTACGPHRRSPSCLAMCPVYDLNGPGAGGLLWVLLHFGFLFCFWAFKFLWNVNRPVAVFRYDKGG